MQLCCCFSATGRRHLGKKLSGKESNITAVLQKLLIINELLQTAVDAKLEKCKDHLLEIVDFAQRNDIIIISDEVYGDMVFNDNVFHPMGSISKDVPVVEIGGSAKIFLVPGWRLGWIVLHDRGGLMKEVCHNQERI